ncbi:MAG: type II secretion system secretin GspD [Thermodesulfobacteriota bacterium]
MTALYMIDKRRARWMALIIAWLLAFSNGLYAQTASPAAPAKVPRTGPDAVKSPADPAKRYVSIDFNNVDIQVFIKFISELTGKNFVVDERVKGKVTIISPSKITEKEAFKVFESVLEVHGFATVKAGEIVKIVPAPDARTKNIDTLLKESRRETDDKIVTQIVPLKYAGAEEVKRLLAPLISKNSVMLSYPQTNMLIMTDIYSNIQRLMRIIDAIDVTGIGREISIIPLVAADAAKLVKILETIFKEDSRTGVRMPPPAVPTVETTKFVADERTNTIILLASEVDTLRAKKLIELLDKDVPRGKGNIHVYYLEHAVAEDMAKVLLLLPSKGPADTVSAVQGGAGKAAQPVVSDKVKITADKATNSLIIMADKDDYMALEEIIQKLDIPRAMVYIECLMMEVDVNKGFSVGTEWMVTGEAKYKGKTGAVGGGYSGSTDIPYGRIGEIIAGAATTSATSATTAGLASYPAGLSMGVFGETIDINGVKFPSLAAVIQAAKKEQGIHILSTPQIVTTDNQEATITVGLNVPYLTKQGSASTAITDIYRNYEYKDVGNKLKVTPQISKDKLVRLNISLEVTKLDTAANTNTEETTPTTLKRTVETTVIVNDRNTVVIGGLIDDSLSKSDSSIPCLGDIPMVGWLFKSVTNASGKTDLYFFLTPHIIKNPAEALEIKERKKAEIEQIMKAGQIKLYKSEADSWRMKSEKKIIGE